MRTGRTEKSKILPCGRPAPEGHRPPSVKRLQARLDEFLHSKSLKKSAARQKILQLIVENKGHFGIRTLLRDVQKSYPEVGPATVYRNISLLMEAEIIRETLVSESGEKLFELAADAHHDHIVCLTCNKVFEFHEAIIEKAQEKLGLRLGFKPAEHKHTIYAHCIYNKKN